MTQPRFPATFFTGSHLCVAAAPPTSRRESVPTAAPPVTQRGGADTLCIYTPVGYEPNYAYPLLVWFHDAGQNARCLHTIVPQISDRNLLGLALCGDIPRAAGGWDWSSDADAVVWRTERLFQAVRSLRRERHIHSERVVLAGSGAGAAAAAQTFFQRPEWFGGLALLNPPADCPPLLARSRTSEAKPGLLALTGTACGTRRDLAGRLSAAGVNLRVHGTAGLPDALRQLDRWLLGALCGAV